MTLWLACSGVGSCGDEQAAPDPSVDADVYADELCETLCAKYDECQPDPEPFGECTVERQTCAEFFNLDINTGPDSTCYDVELEFGACLSRHFEPESGE